MVDLICLLVLIFMICYLVKQGRDKEKARCKEIINFRKGCEAEIKKKLDEIGMSNEDRIKKGYGKFINK